MRVRIAAVQYMLRHVDNWAGFQDQVDFVLNAAADYKPQFVLLPEIFTTQLLSYYPSEDIPAAVRELAKYTERYVELLSGHARRHGYFLVGGSHPRVHEGRLLNTSFLFTPSGDVHTQDKLHRTRWEKEKWNTDQGDVVRVFETPYGKIAILVCYDIEFPELARSVAEAGAEIVFVPSCTDDRQGFLRVRYCCHARAIENQIYVAMTSTVGNLPVAGLRLHYGQAAIITPSDFPFARDGIAAEGVINEEQIIVGDVDLALLDENRLKGTTIPLLDKRGEFYRQAPEYLKVSG